MEDIPELIKKLERLMKETNFEEAMQLATQRAVITGTGYIEMKYTEKDGYKFNFLDEINEN